MSGSGGIMSTDLGIIVRGDGKVDPDSAKARCGESAWLALCSQVDEMRARGEEVAALLFKGVTTNEIIALLFRDGADQRVAKADVTYPC